MEGGVVEPPAVLRVEVDFVEGRPAEESLERWLERSERKLREDRRRRSLRKEGMTGAGAGNQAARLAGKRRCAVGEGQERRRERSRDAR